MTTPRETRSRRTLLIATAVWAVAIATVGVTAAGFTQTITANGTVVGAFDIAQGAVAADQHSTAATAKEIAVTFPSAGAPIASLFAAPTGEPNEVTAAVIMTLQTTSDSGAATVSFALKDLSGAMPAADWAALRFGLDVITGPAVTGTPYPPHTSLLPDAIPLSAAELEALATPPSTALVAAGAESAQVMIRVWLAPDALASAYGMSVPLGIEAFGSSAGGKTVDVEVSFP